MSVNPFASPRLGRALVACACVFALGCETGDDDGTIIDAGAARMLERTVRIGVLRVGERMLQELEDGTVVYPEVIPLGDVRVCAAQRRAAFASFTPFAALEPAICETNASDETVQLAGVPANSDLILTYDKPGYIGGVTTFRSDEFDVAVPSWADNMAWFVPLLREGTADLWLEPEPPPGDGDGVVAIWVLATGDWGRGDGRSQFGSEADPGSAQAEGVGVEVEDALGRPVAELQTLRDRPRFVSLPPGEYAFRFSHPLMELVPLGVQEQFMITGLPTSDFATIEVPVIAGRLSLAALELYCPLPADARAFADVSTCSLEDEAQP